MKVRITAALAAASIIVSMAASPGALAQDKNITVGVAAPPQTMNPHGSDADSNLSVMSNIFEGLLRRDTSGTLKPALATEWQRVDKNTWRFKLRKDVKFHNGNPFTWEDVKFTFDRLKNPEVSEFISFGSLIDSVEPVNGDDWTIDVKTKEPVPYFDQNLHQIFIMDKESTESRDAGDVGQKPIGTGPYKFDEWVKGSYLKLSRNDDYWGDKPAIAHAEFQPVTEASTGMAAIMSGTVDILQDVPVASLKAIQRSPKVELISRPSRRSIWLGINNREGSPTADPRVRRAMYLAINEPQIIDTVMFGQATPAAQIPDPPTTGHSDQLKRPDYDPEQAKKLLQDAGYGDGFKITLTGPNDRYVQDEQILAAVASDLAKVGIDVSVDAKPKSIYFGEVSDNKLDFYLLGWFDGSYDFGRSYSKLLHCVDKDAGFGGTNGAAYCNKDADAMYEKSRQMVDTEKRAEQLRKLNEYLQSDDVTAVIPLHFQQDLYAVAKDRGIQFTPRSDTWIELRDIDIAAK